jgi:hypothetical protein
VILASFETVKFCPPLEQELVADEPEPRSYLKSLLLGMSKEILQLFGRNVPA